MTIRAYTLATLVAHVDTLAASDAMTLAARWGLLPDLLTQADYDDSRDDADDWEHLWSLHRAAGHAQPAHEHTADDCAVADQGAVWGVDCITVLGYLHEEGWCGCYGGEHGGQQYGWGGPRADQWAVYADNTGSALSAIAAGYAAAYRIDLDLGQPAEPSVDDLTPDIRPCETRYVLRPHAERGVEVEAVEITRHTHPWDGRDDDDESESHYPVAYGCDMVGIDDSWAGCACPAALCRLHDLYDSRRDLMVAIREVLDAAWEASGSTQPDECVYQDEDDATTAVIRHWAEIARDQHEEPHDVSLIIPRDESPYVHPAPDDDAALHYHLDENEARSLALHGWSALMLALADAWGTRRLLDSMTDLRDRAESILAERSAEVWVSIGSSLGAGNCYHGTEAFLRRIGLDGIGACRADWLLSLADADAHAPHIRRACRAAALGIR